MIFKSESVKKKNQAKVKPYSGSSRWADHEYLIRLNMTAAVKA
jgi:hypothetical protein